MREGRARARAGAPRHPPRRTDLTPNDRPVLPLRRRSSPAGAVGIPLSFQPNLPFRRGSARRKLVGVVHTDASSDIRRLSDLRRAQPGDPTLQNLLGILNAKLEFSARLPVYEYEARSQGHERCARAFRRLAQLERETFDEILSCLRAHLDDGRDPQVAPADTKP
jgi:hypothetical protein